MSNTPQSEETLDSLLHEVYLAGWNDKLCDNSPTYVPTEMQTKLHTKLALTAYIDGIVSEVIGEDEAHRFSDNEWYDHDDREAEAHNELRDNQRAHYQAIKQERGLV